MVKGLVPIIDLEDKNCDEFLDVAWREVGFACVVGHGINPNLFSSMRNLLKELFSLPNEIKSTYQITPENYRGFIPLGFFTPNRGERTGTQADIYEAFKLHWECPEEHPVRKECSLYGSNRWIDELGDMSEIISTYWDACDDLSEKLLRFAAKSLNADKTSPKSAK